MYNGLQKAQSRDRKRKKARYGMKISGRSVFIIQEINRKRAEELDKKENK